MPKKRTPIPQHVAARVLFEADRTCCVCRTPGKPVQIHHIDEDPSNNSPTNLAVLCLDCHNETQLAGGFGRKLDADQVTLYRDDWNRMIQRGRISVEIAAAGDSPSDAQIAYTMELAEVFRENGDFTMLAGLYDDVGNIELRDKYIDEAISAGADDESIIWLRGMQKRPDLVPEEVAERRLAELAATGAWTLRARALRDLGRPLEAVGDFVRGIGDSLERGGYFSAAFYLDEIFMDDVTQTLYEAALEQATREGDLWWQVRSLQELGWAEELHERVLASEASIRGSGDPKLLEVLVRELGDTRRADSMRAEMARQETAIDDE